MPAESRPAMTDDAASLRRWPASRRPMGMGMIMPISELSAYGGTAAPRFRNMLELTRTAEAVGFDIVWIPDHLIVRHAADGDVVRGVWEAWTTIAGLAAATERIQLGLFVTCTGFRPPAIVAKMAENLDEISDGRFILGLGAGWHQPEYEMFGYPFDHRVDRFEEALQIIVPLVREGTADFHGRYYEVNDAVNRPRGPRAEQGGMPIIIGAKQPRMMRLTARYADAWNSDWMREPAELAAMLARLDDACRQIGRAPDTLVRTTSANIALPGFQHRRPNCLTGDQTALAEQIRGFQALGPAHFVGGFDPCTPQGLEWFAPVLELLAQS